MPPRVAAPPVSIGVPSPGRGGRPQRNLSHRPDSRGARQPDPVILFLILE